MKHILLLSMCLLFLSNVFAQNQRDTTYTDQRQGFEREHFVFQGRKAWLIKPTKGLPGKPWVWRAHFPEWHTEVDSILLSEGFHIVYLNTNDMFGSNAAMQIWDAFYEYLVRQRGFSPIVALEGVSRGGLYVYQWAKRNPLKVSCIYAEAPVCDIKSWPGGKGKGKGSPQDWNKLLAEYQFSEEDALGFLDNPMDNLQGLAACKIPILHSVSLKDSIVPYLENTFPLVQRYINLGGPATIMPMTKGKQNLEGHHFPIENPERIAQFIKFHTLQKGSPLPPSDFHVLRSDFQHSFLKFKNEKKGVVAFMGGSITESDGWRNKVCQYLKEKFPETAFEFINAGIASTGSTPGAFRLSSEVLAKGKIDLLFEEAAVNDRTNGFDSLAQIRGMEGIVRQAKRSNPQMDIVLMHFVDPEKLIDYQKGVIPSEIQNHERVAEHYQVNSIHLAKEVYERIKNKEFTWADDFKDLHPSPFGQEVYFQSIKTFLNNAFNPVPKNDVNTVYTLPDILNDGSYDKGRYLSIKNAEIKSDFLMVDSWKPKDGAGTRKQYVNIPALIGEKPDAAFQLEFTGNTIGICVASGPDAGIISYSIDGKPFKKLDLFTRWSENLHLPWYLMLGQSLNEKKHTLRVRILTEKNQKSKGNACRILHFLVNDGG
ncbi:MAG: GDSL-type esterase/lipase family protein [Saprospiraceae bacterium]